MAYHSVELDSIPAIEKSFLSATIVICTRNRPGPLRECLEGIAQLKRTPNEVIVVDNTSGDKETEAVAGAFDAIYLVEPITGLSRARNRGLKESTSEVVAFLDDDATPETHWLELLLEPFEDSQVTVVTGRIVTPRSSLGGDSKPTVRSLSNKNPEWFGIATFGGFGLGSNMAFRRKACVGMNIFDERLGRGAPFEIAEENYAFALLLSHGYKAIQVPHAIVFHPAGGPCNVVRDARNSIVFAMLLFSEFPRNRRDLIRFLFRRIQRKPLSWPRDSPDPGEIITSGWLVLLSASLSAALLFFRTRKSKEGRILGTH